MATNIRLFLGTCCTGLALLAVSIVPAYSKCIQKHPIFGIDTYVEDKYCPKPKAKKKRVTKKKAIKKKAAKKRVVRKKVKKKRVARLQPRPANKPLLIGEAPDPEIKEMQTLLAKMGYNPGPADGYEGPKTKAAAKAFKKAVGLRVGTDAEETIEMLKRISGN